MRKIVAAVTAGLLLVAGQAAANADVQAVARVGDRVGAQAGESEQLAPAVIIGILATVAIIGGAIALADSDDEPDSN